MNPQLRIREGRMLTKMAESRSSDSPRSHKQFSVTACGTSGAGVPRTWASFIPSSSTAGHPRKSAGYLALEHAPRQKYLCKCPVASHGKQARNVCLSFPMLHVTNWTPLFRLSHPYSCNILFNFLTQTNTNLNLSNIIGTRYLVS